MTQINIQIIGNGTVKQKPARIGPAIQLTAIPNSGATFIGWKGLGQSFTSGLSTCNVNPRYASDIVAVFSENPNPNQYQEVAPNTLNPLQFEHAPELISEKSALSNQPKFWIDDPTIQVSKVFDELGRFIINDDGTITDSDSELMWMNPKKIKKSTISKALQMSVHYAGYDDWRLPSIFELKSIMPMNEISPPRNYFSSTINTSLSDSGNYYDLIRSDGKRFLAWEKSAKEEYILFVRNINFFPLSQTNSGSGVGTVTIKILNGFK